MRWQKPRKEKSFTHGGRGMHTQTDTQRQKNWVSQWWRCNAGVLYCGRRKKNSAKCLPHAHHR